MILSKVNQKWFCSDLLKSGPFILYCGVWQTYLQYLCNKLGKNVGPVQTYKGLLKLSKNLHAQNFKRDCSDFG